MVQIKLFLPSPLIKSHLTLSSPTVYIQHHSLSIQIRRLHYSKLQTLDVSIPFRYKISALQIDMCISSILSGPQLQSIFE